MSLKQVNFLMTPYEKLKSLPKSEKYLKDGVTFEIMDKITPFNNN